MKHRETAMLDPHKAQRVLIVEDQFLIAIHIADIVEELGFEVIGPVTSSKEALQRLEEADIALVDVNLSDGATGHLVAARFAEAGAAVIFLTGSEDTLEDHGHRAIGVIGKPIFDHDIDAVLQFIVAQRNGEPKTAPGRLRLFKQAVTSITALS